MSEQNEPEVTLDAIDAALGDLLKAADATDLAKAYGGVSVDQGGHTDERGQTSGGYADTGDVGTLDSMMIGKMGETLIDAGYPAEMVVAFMSGKQEDDDEDDEEMEGKMGKPADMSGGVGTNPRTKASAGGSTMAKMKGKKGKMPFAMMEDDDEGDDAEKSLEHDLQKSFTDDPAIADAIDVSPFLEALVQRTVENINVLGKSLHAGQAEQTDVNRTMAGALYGMGQLVKSLHGHSQRLEERLGMVERQPMPAKGHTRLTGAQPVRKSFGSHGMEAGTEDQLNKSELVATLTYMNLEKGIKEVGGMATSELAGLAEAGGQIHPNALAAAQRFLSTHPGEARTARSYR